MTFEENSNSIAFRISIYAAVALVAMYLVNEKKKERFRKWVRPTIEENSESPWSRRLDPVSLLTILWLVVLVQIALQSLREVYALIRYFMIGYPAIYITLMGVVWLLFDKWRWHAQTIAALMIIPFMVLKWHPIYISILQDKAVEELEEIRLPKREVASNGEENLMFLDWFDFTHNAANKLEKYYPDGAIIVAPWPFSVYLTNPEFGLTDVRNRMRQENETPEAIFKYSTEYPGMEIDDVELPDEWYIERTFERDAIWCLLILPDEFNDRVEEDEAISDDGAVEENTDPQKSSDQPDA